MSYRDLTDAEQKLIRESLEWLGYDKECCVDVDICESGQVFFGLTEILPRNSVKWEMSHES